jgi:hypothetical protein
MKRIYGGGPAVVTEVMREGRTTIGLDPAVAKVRHCQRALDYLASEFFGNKYFSSDFSVESGITGCFIDFNSVPTSERDLGRFLGVLEANGGKYAGSRVTFASTAALAETINASASVLCPDKKDALLKTFALIPAAMKGRGE